MSSSPPDCELTKPQPHSDPASLVGFGEAYYDQLARLIDKHLQLVTDDNVCYVGDEFSARVVPVLTEQYCLVKPVTVVNPYTVRDQGLFFA